MATTNTLRLSVLLVAFASVLCYLPEALELQYVWDDWELFLNDPTLRDGSISWDDLTRPVLPGTTYFRPLPLGSMAAEFSTFGVDPQTSHIINLIIHFFNTFLVGLIGVHLIRHMGLPLSVPAITVATLFYGLHPSLVEPVAWTAGRFDLLVTLFSLLAIWGHIALRGILSTTWVAIAFLLAALSKEMAATLPAILLLLDLATQPADRPWRQRITTILSSGRWRTYVAVIAAGLLYLLLRVQAIGALLHHDASVEDKLLGLSSHLAFVGQTFLFYIKMALLPFSDMSPQHPFDPALMSAADRFLGWITLATLTAATLLILRLRYRPGLVFVAFIVSLLPIANFIPLTIGGNLGHDRFLAFPLTLLSFGFLTLGLDLRRLLSAPGRRLALVIPIFWLIVATLTLRSTIPFWANDFSLWSWAYAKQPDSAYVRASLAAASVRYGYYDKAEEVLKDIDEDSPLALRAFKGQFLVRTGKIDEGLEYLRGAASALPALHEEIGEFGIDYARAQVQRSDNNLWLYKFIYTALAEAYISKRQFNQALTAANISLFYSPRYGATWLARAFAHYGLDNQSAGDADFEKALSLYTAPTILEARTIKQEFLKKLCEGDADSEVCSRFYENNHDTSPSS